MRDPRRSPLPRDERGRLARLLVIALGLLGFVAVPAGASVPAGPGQGAAQAAVQTAGPNAPGRSRTAPRSSPATRTEAAVAAVVRQVSGASAPAPAVAAPPAGVDVRPPSGRAVRRAMAAEPFVAALPGAPRGRAPPLPALI
ncbi:hypothetical protein [Spirillospora sp. NBC_01491]|uniref:hypothetical protein n=1 Tax=Spirillospora sp. NBC_01491 TaxID=2976007 RepID=UPI002E30E1B7|nr:hypothetical protein [Spirillospora sp. NBC_01491]